MKEYQPQLSICIQTYNRCKYLKDALESIATQLTPELSKDVEVVISDNASTDETRVIVNSFKPRIPLLTYSRNKKNLGFDGNTNAVIHHARGKYCWYLGDDDILIPNSIKYMLAQCNKNAYAIISTASKPLLGRENLKNISALQQAEVRTYESSDPNESYFNDYYPSALSLLCFRRDLWLRISNFQNHTPGWFYFETVLQIAISTDLPTLHIKYPLVLTGQDCRWADKGEGLYIFINCSRFLARMAKWDQYDTVRIRDEIERNQKKFIRVLLSAKSRKLPTTLENFRLMHTYTQHLPLHQSLLADLIFWIPNSLFIIARKMKQKNI